MKKSILIVVLFFLSFSTFAIPNYTGSITASLSSVTQTQAIISFSWILQAHNGHQIVLGDATHYAVISFVEYDSTTHTSLGAQLLNYSCVPGDSVKLGVVQILSGFTAGHYIVIIPKIILHEDTEGDVVNQNGSTLVFQMQCGSASVNANSFAICGGGSVNLSASGGSSYSWSPANGLSNPNISNPVASPVVTTTYTVTVMVGSCPSTNTITVTVGQAPTVTASGPSGSVCSGTPTTLSASGTASTYTWLPTTGLNTASGSSVIATPSSNTTYTVTGTLNGCSATATIPVTLTGVTLIYTNPVVTICPGSSVILSVTGANSYSWNPATGLSNPVSDITNASPSATTTYTVTAVSGSCTGTVTVTVTVEVPVVPTLTSDELRVCKTGMSTGSNPTRLAHLHGLPAGGIYGVNGTTLASNVFDATTEPAGTVNAVYTYTSPNGCVSSTTTSIQDDSIPAVSHTSVTVNGNQTQLNVFGGPFIDDVQVQIIGSSIIYSAASQQSSYLEFGPFPTSVLTNGTPIKIMYPVAGCFTQPGMVNVAETIKKEDLNIFPNPVSNVFHMEFPYGKYTIKIVNILGQSVRDIAMEGASLDVERGDLPAGDYFVTFTIDGKKEGITKKVIVL